MPTAHTVQQGECFSSLAARYGYAWKVLWNHSLNAQLRQLRKDPAVLYPGDVVNVPDKELKEEARPTDARHRFQKLGEPTHIRIRLLLDDEPRRGIPYELDVDGKKTTGKTDGGGFLQADVAPDARGGVLVVGDGPVHEVYQLAFGTLDPIDTEDGVRERLGSLGYDVQEKDLAAAVRGFQAKEGLPPTGTIDDGLRTQLNQRYGQ